MTDIKKTSSFIHDGGGIDYDSDYGTFEDGGMSSKQSRQVLYHFQCK